jgi:hypothetical protein
VRTLDTIVNGGEFWNVSWHDADGMLLVSMVVDQVGLDIIKASPNMVLEGGETAIVVTITPLKTWTKDDDAPDAA